MYCNIVLLKYTHNGTTAIKLCYRLGRLGKLVCKKRIFQIKGYVMTLGTSIYCTSVRLGLRLRLSTVDGPQLFINTVTKNKFLNSKLCIPSFYYLDPHSGFRTFCVFAPTPFVTLWQNLKKLPAQHHNVKSSCRSY